MAFLCDKNIKPYFFIENVRHVPSCILNKSPGKTEFLEGQERSLSEIKGGLDTGIHDMLGQSEDSNQKFLM